MRIFEAMPREVLFLIFMQDLRLIMELRTWTYRGDTTKQLSLGELPSLPRVLWVADIRTMAPLFFTALSGTFPKEGSPPPPRCHPKGIVHALLLLNAERQARKQHVPYLKSLI